MAARIRSILLPVLWVLAAPWAATADTVACNASTLGDYMQRGSCLIGDVTFTFGLNSLDASGPLGPEDIRVAPSGYGLTFSGPFYASGFGFQEYLIRYRVSSAIPMAGASLWVERSAGEEGLITAQALVSRAGDEWAVMAAPLVTETGAASAREAFADYGYGPGTAFDVSAELALVPNGGQASAEWFRQEFQPVPEPGSGWYLGLGVVAVVPAWRAWRRRAAARALLLAAAAAAVPGSALAIPACLETGLTLNQLMTDPLYSNGCAVDAFIFGSDGAGAGGFSFARSVRAPLTAASILVFPVRDEEFRGLRFSADFTADASTRTSVIYTIAYAVHTPLLDGRVGAAVLNGTTSQGGRYTANENVAGAPGVTLNIRQEGAQSAAGNLPLSGGLAYVTNTITLTRTNAAGSSAHITDVLNVYDVPEPGAWGPAGVAAAAIFWLRMRRRGATPG